MALLGQGAMVFWHDVVDGDEDYNHWHAFEHMAERVGIAGFFRGRRYLAVDGGPAYFNMYETESAATLTSDDYLARLNSPTPWTQRSLAKFANSNRSLCSVTKSIGRGIGGALLSVQFAPADGRAAALRAWLSSTATQLSARSGVVGAHLLETDDAASRMQTAEKSLRGTDDEVADWVLLVEALDQDVLATVRSSELSDGVLLEHGVGEIQNIARYRLYHVLSDEDLA